MDRLNVLMGGRTGDGVLEMGLLLCRLFSRLGYYVYLNNDYPSIIVGGHQFVLVRMSQKKVTAHVDQVDVVVALNQDAIDFHKDRWHAETVVLYNSGRENVSADLEKIVGIPISELLEEEKADIKQEQMAMLGALVKTIGIPFKRLLQTWSLEEDGENKNLQNAVKKGYEAVEPMFTINKGNKSMLPVLTGSDAISLGLLEADVEAYIAYPMTPTSPILEFMARHEKELGLHVSLPESEIAVIMQALGYAYMGVKAAVGTSGGGFSLMTESLSLAGQAELPTVIILGQRGGPGTGMPTYTAQSELSFALSAGHGEFSRLVAAPGDAEEAFYWAALSVNLAWTYQIPSIILVDKTLCLNSYSFDAQLIPLIPEVKIPEWDKKGTYQRYEQTSSGVSPLAHPPLAHQAVKTNSYVHDEYGLTSEKSEHASAVVTKRFRKVKAMVDEIADYEPVKTTGEGNIVLVSWGSNKGACLEVSDKLGLKFIQLIVMAPFPEQELKKALSGAEKVICAEMNYQGQMAMLLQQHGITVDHRIGKFDGRPFSREELENEVKKVIK